MIVQLKRSEAFELLNPLLHCSRIGAARGENADEVRRFAYYCGRNRGKLISIDKETERLQAKIQMREIGDYTAYRGALDKAARKFARKDRKTGEPITVQSKTDDRAIYSMTKAKEEQFLREVEKIDKKYAAAKAAERAKLDELNAVGEQVVEVDLFTWEYAKLPKNINGAFIAAIHPMLTDRPDQQQKA